MIKKLIAYLVSWTLFWMGDLVSRLIDNEDTFNLYSMSNKLMNASLSVQDWAENKTPWTPNED
jgi:hypothetical protein